MCFPGEAMFAFKWSFSELFFSSFFCSFSELFFYNISITNSKTSKVNQQSVLNH